MKLNLFFAALISFALVLPVNALAGPMTCGLEGVNFTTVASRCKLNPVSDMYGVFMQLNLTKEKSIKRVTTYYILGGPYLYGYMQAEEVEARYANGEFSVFLALDDRDTGSTISDPWHYDMMVQAEPEKVSFTNTDFLWPSGGGVDARVIRMDVNVQEGIFLVPAGDYMLTATIATHGPHELLEQYRMVVDQCSRTETDDIYVEPVNHVRHLVREYTNGEWRFVAGDIILYSNNNAHSMPTNKKMFPSKPPTPVGG